MLTRHLENLGCNVDSTISVEEAQRKVNAQNYKLIIVSTILTKGSAFEFCKFVRRTYNKNQLPIIITSVIESGTLICESTTKWGANECVILPVPEKYLIKMIQFHLGQSKKRPSSIVSLQLARSQYQMKKKKEKRKLPTKGDLSEQSFSKILKVLGKSKRTGELIIGRDNDAFSLIGVNGNLVKIKSPYVEKLTLKKIILSQGQLNQKTLAPFIERVEHEKTLLGRMLLESGVMKKDEIAKLLAHQLILKTQLLFKKKEGQYQFRKLTNNVDNDFPFSVSVAEIFLEFYKHRVSADRFNKLYGNKSDQSPKLNKKGVYSLDDFDLPEDQLKAMKKFNGFVTLKDVVDYSDVSPEVLMPIVHTFISLKLIKLK